MSLLLISPCAVLSCILLESHSRHCAGDQRLQHRAKLWPALVLMSASALLQACDASMNCCCCKQTSKQAAGTCNHTAAFHDSSLHVRHDAAIVTQRRALLICSRLLLINVLLLLSSEMIGCCAVTSSCTSFRSLQHCTNALV